MRYFKRTSEGYHASDASWGDPTYWLEVNERGDAERQLEMYPNGNVLRYDRAHPEDEYGGLGIMVIDGNEEEWAVYEITRGEFEEQWGTHTPLNRGIDSQLIDELIQNNPKFQALVAKSRASLRKPFALRDRESDNITPQQAGPAAEAT